jgi:hypothetical protein
LPVERLRPLIEAIKTNQNAQAAFDAEVRSFRKDTPVEEKKKEEEPTAAAVEEKKAKTVVPWTDDELGLLAQGIARYPGGSPNRWRMIADLVNSKVRLLSPVCVHMCNLGKLTRLLRFRRTEPTVASRGLCRRSSPRWARSRLCLRRVPCPVCRSRITSTREYVAFTPRRSHPEW